MQQQSLPLTVRPATEEDLPRILDIYAGARRRMAAGGNATQWGDHYPPADLLAEELHAGCLYAIVGAGILRGVFSFRIGPDPTYARIGRVPGSPTRPTAPFTAWQATERHTAFLLRPSPSAAGGFLTCGSTRMKTTASCKS